MEKNMKYYKKCILMGCLLIPVFALLMASFNGMANGMANAIADDQYGESTDFSDPIEEEMIKIINPADLKFTYYIIETENEEVLCEKYEYEDKWIVMNNIIKSTNEYQELSTEKYYLEKETVTKITKMKALSKDAVIKILTENESNGGCECFIGCMK
jgi:hypothetical protein